MREWLIDKREAKGKSVEEMALLCECSKTLIYCLELGADITHSNIAARIAHHYGLTLEEYNDLVSEDRRAKRLPRVKAAPKKKEYKKGQEVKEIEP